MTPADQLLFTNSFGAATLIPFYSELIFHVMRYFGTFDMSRAAVIASLASTLGGVVNWGIGNLLIRLRGVFNYHLTDEQLARARGFFLRYLSFLLLVPWIPLIGIVMVAAGFFRMKLWQFCLMVLAGRAAYYFYLAANPPIHPY